jgi:hypothetical protein
MAGHHHHEEIVMALPISTPNAPAALGPYSQAVRAGDTVYLSGQIPLDPKTGELVEGGFEAQVHQAFRNLKAVVEAAGGRTAKGAAKASPGRRSAASPPGPVGGAAQGRACRGGSHAGAGVSRSRSARHAR